MGYSVDANIILCASDSRGPWRSQALDFLASDGVRPALIAETPVRGNLVPDAHLAAILVEHGVGTLYSHDRDFLKFSIVQVEDPLAP